jgi:hypothetical protein
LSRVQEQRDAAQGQNAGNQGELMFPRPAPEERVAEAHQRDECQCEGQPRGERRRAEHGHRSGCEVHLQPWLPDEETVPDVAVVGEIADHVATVRSHGEARVKHVARDERDAGLVLPQARGAEFR